MTQKKVKIIVTLLSALIMLLSLVPMTTLTAYAESNQYKVLFWCPEDTYAVYANVIKDFYSEIDGVTVISKTQGAITNEELDGVKLVYIVDWSQGTETLEGQNIINSAPLLKEFVVKGGRVVMNAEWNGFAEAGNVTLSTLASEMGGNFTILDDNSNEMTMNYNTEEKPTLTDNLDSNFRPNAFAPIQSTNPDAIWVVKDNYNNIFVLDQKVENGYITVISDVNWIYDGLSNDAVKAKAIQFLKNLLVDTVQNINSVTIIAPTVTAPIDKTFNYGQVNGKLGVTATVDSADENTLSYQWYKNNTKSNEGGTIISGATDSTYTIPSDLEVGEYYYYCKVTVTYTINGATASTTSDVATITVTKESEKAPKREQKQTEKKDSKRAVILRKSTSPKTKDNSPLGLWITLMIISLCSLVTKLFIKKRAFNR